MNKHGFTVYKDYRRGEYDEKLFKIWNSSIGFRLIFRRCRFGKRTKSRKYPAGTPANTDRKCAARAKIIVRKFVRQNANIVMTSETETVAVKRAANIAAKSEMPAVITVMKERMPAATIAAIRVAA